MPDPGAVGAGGSLSRSCEARLAVAVTGVLARRSGAMSRRRRRPPAQRGLYPTCTVRADPDRVAGPGARSSDQRGHRRSSAHRGTPADVRRRLRRGIGQCGDVDDPTATTDTGCCTVLIRTLDRRDNEDRSATRLWRRPTCRSTLSGACATRSRRPHGRAHSRACRLTAPLEACTTSGTGCRSRHPSARSRLSGRRRNGDGALVRPGSTAEHGSAQQAQASGRGEQTGDRLPPRLRVVGPHARKRMRRPAEWQGPARSSRRVASRGRRPRTEPAGPGARRSTRTGPGRSSIGGTTLPASPERRVATPTAPRASTAPTSAAAEKTPGRRPVSAHGSNT